MALFGKDRREVADRVRSSRERGGRYLNLRDVGLAQIPDDVFGMSELEELDLSTNKLRTIPERLWDLPRLRSVFLMGNPIERLPDRPGLVVDVPTYRRVYDQLDPNNVELFVDNDTERQDAKFVDSGRLRKLTVTGTWSGFEMPQPTRVIGTFLDSLSAFGALQSLSLDNLGLGTVPEGIQHLRQLKHLALDRLSLKCLPDWIGQLDLLSLRAAYDGLSSLPDSLRSVVNLKILYLAGNPLERLPAVIFDLVSLDRLNVLDCRLREIPAEILRLNRLKLFDCGNNSIESPPAEIVSKGLDAIRDYWRQRADTGVDYLCEAKLIILGEAGAGKTSLAHKILNPDYKLDEHEKSTEGIAVTPYRFPSAVRTKEREEKLIQRTFQANIWDFGGQEIYHATHQFFLTRRSVYLLVCDDRKEDTDFDYWLQAVEMLSDASPLLIIQNEKQDRTRDINLSGLRARFGNLRGAIATNLDTNRGLDAVIQSIRKELESLPHVGVELPATWRRVRGALEEDARDYIGLQEYLDTCEGHGFTRPEYKLQLSGYLHDLGICLHFQDDPVLKHTVVLKPSWGTDAVYRVLDDPEVKAARGRFTREQLGRIWHEPKYDGMQDELLRLMMKFQLCYELEAGQGYVAPQLRSSDQPAYPWEQMGGLVVRYEYVFLPKGIVTRFIVAMHRLIAGGDLVWKYGVVLERDGTRAEIVEEYSERRIRVRVAGQDPRSLLSIVDEQLERLHASFPRLQYERFLPCPCSECRTKAEPEGFPLEKLKTAAAKRRQIQCHASLEMVDAASLVLDILPGALQPENGAAPQTCPPPAAPEVFVSYAWTPESSAVVDGLQEALGQEGIRLIRDREEVRFKDSISDFMWRIGKGKCVVVVISDKYLKSKNCMFEMVEIAKAERLRERIFPIVLADADIYDDLGLLRYVQYWEGQSKALHQGLNSLEQGHNLTNLQASLNLYAEIRRLIDGITGTLRDMNALTPAQHEGTGFEELIRRIRAAT